MMMRLVFGGENGIDFCPRIASWLAGRMHDDEIQSLLRLG